MPTKKPKPVALDDAHFAPNAGRLGGIGRLKFTSAQAGVDELASKGWRTLATFGPMPDGLTYTLLGLPLDARDERIAELEAELAALRKG